MTSFFIRPRLTLFCYIHYNVSLKNGQPFVVNVEKTVFFKRKKNGCSQRIEKRRIFTKKQTQEEAYREKYYSETKTYSMNAYYPLCIGSCYKMDEYLFYLCG